MTTGDAWRWNGVTSSTETADDDGATTSAIIKIALIVTYIAAAATPWNALKFGGLRLGDAMIGLALVIFFFADLGRPVPKLPSWVWQFGAIIVLVAVAHEIVPTDAHYLASRLVINGNYTLIINGRELESNGVVGIKFLVPAVFMPLLFSYAFAHDKRAIVRSAYAFAIGAAISAFIGFSDLLGVTHLSLSITGAPALNNRAPGLTIHPNFLAMTSVIGLPILVWHLVAPRLRSRLIALGLIIILLLGLYASGSRAGAGVGPGVLLLAVAIMPRFRRFLPTIALATGAIAAFIFVLNPSLGSALLSAVRLGGSDTGSAASSDQSRAVIFSQGVSDFKHSPIDGVGLQVAEEAHNVYLQALAAGGVILLAGYLIFVVGGLAKAVNQMKVDPLAYPLFAAAVGSAVFLVVQAALTDRIAYMALTLIAAMPPGRAADPEFAELMSLAGPVEEPREPLPIW